MKLTCVDGRCFVRFFKALQLALWLTLAWFLCASLVRADADSDFAARCGAAGVVKCYNFDDTSTQIVQNTNLFPNGASQFLGTLDTSVKASGAGSLRFELPPPPTAGANISGSWDDTMGTTFGQGSTFYIQFRQRFSQHMLDNTWDSSWKTAIFHYNTQTCGSIEITTVNYFLSNLINSYTDCGSRAFWTALDGHTWSNTTPLLLQQGDYNCQYGNTNPTDCLYFVADEWMTFYYKIHVGTWDNSTTDKSTMEMWVAREGGQYKKVVNVIDSFSLSCNTDPCASEPGASQGYNKVTFLPYMTGLDPNSGLPGVTSYVWYDELIISTQPIREPAAAAGSSGVKIGTGSKIRVGTGAKLKVGQ